MKTSKIIISLFIGIAMLTAQVRSVLAAPAMEEGLINGTVTALECIPATGDATSILVTFDDENGVSQQTEIDLETAQNLGLVAMGEDEKPDCSETAFQAILDSLSEDEPQHPVGVALAAIFSQITDYETIMKAHDGEFEAIGSTGFGVIAQALWITKNYLKDGSEADFLAILESKKTGDFSYFSSYFSGDETPANWGQFKKAMLNGDKKNNLGTVMSDKDNKEDKTNNGKGHDNGNKDKDKDKKKDG